MSTTIHRITAEELVKLPRDRFRYEVVQGELLTMSPVGAKGQGKLLYEQDDLTGDDVVPGFRVPISEIFV